MSVILVVETDASYVQRISEAMQSTGLRVEVCESAESAARRAALSPPSLLVASSALKDVRALLGRFARARGGPGSVAMIPTTLVGRISAGDYHADALLPKPFTAEEARQVLLPMLAAEEPQPQQLSSAEIFGDVLAEVERRTSAPRPALKLRSLSSSSAEIDRKLEETLSGVLAVPEPQGPVRARAKKTSTEDIDELLDRTLSSLELPRKKKRPASPAPPPDAPPAPVDAETAPVDAAPAPVDAPPAPVDAVPVFEPPPPLDAPPLPSVAATAATAETAEEPVPAGLLLPPLPPAAGDPAAGTAPLPAGLDEYRTQRLAVVAPRESAEGETFGDYTLIGRIAVGGMAEVWQARRRGVEGFRKTVAIKKILSHLTGSSDFVSMFIDEAKLAAQLNHNNIIQIYDLGKVGEDFFIAMEHVDGMDVRTILGTAQRKGRPLPMRLALSIASSVARALDYAHRKRDFDNQALGLVHRDVSPQNILISYEGEIKLCDFGIVKAVAKASTTQMGALKGKLQYMSPEQAWGKTVDARSDIFSLGSVLFEMLTGTRLFTGDSEIGVLDAVRECRVRSLQEIVPGIPEEVDRIVRRALAKDPVERYQTAGEMEEDLKQVIQGLKPMPSPGELASYLEELAAAPEPVEPGEPGEALQQAPAEPLVETAETSGAPISAAEPSPPAPEEIADQPIARPAGAIRPEKEETRRTSPLVKLLIAAVLLAAVAAVVVLVLQGKIGRGTPGTTSSSVAPTASPAEGSPAEGSPAEGSPAEDGTEGSPRAEPAEDLSGGGGAAPGNTAEPSSPGAAAPVTDQPAGEEMDLEGMVDEELARQRQEIEKRLEQELGAQKRQLQKELEAARKAAEAAKKDGGGG